MSDSRQFFEALFSTVPEQYWTYLWTHSPKKRSHWNQVNKIDELVADAERIAETTDVYVALAVSGHKGTEYERFTRENAAGIMGLWADLDIQDVDAHKKFNLPPDLDAVRDLMKGAGVEPTILVHSGHGVQAWWLFHEFWEFEDDEDRNEAQRLSEAWNTTLRIRAAERQWTVDSTFDLTRIFRIPGTINYKVTDKPVPTKILDFDDTRRFNPTDFDEFLVDEVSAQQWLNVTPTRNYIVDGDLKFDPSANPPFEKFEALRENNDLFKASVDRTRRDLKDQSASSYDLSLASIAVASGWSDQEVIDLIIFARRKHGDEQKGIRPDYAKRTIAKAHDQTASERATEVIEEAAHAMQEAKATGDDEDVRQHRREALDGVSQKFGIEIIRIQKLNSDPPQYQLVTPTKTITIGSSRDLMSWSTTAQAVADALDHFIPRFKQKDYDKIVQVILSCAELIETGQEATEAGRIQLWITDYVLTCKPVDEPDKAIVSKYPFYKNGHVYVQGDALKRWIQTGRGEVIKHHDFARMLRAYGAETEQMAFKLEGGKRTSRSVWRLPDAIKEVLEEMVTDDE